MDYLADFGATKPSRLDVIARLCGMPGKLGVDGKDVAPLIREQRFEEVRNYCLSDVVQTAAIFLRVQLVRGELTRDAYLRAMSGLLALLRSDGRLAGVAEGLNEPRLLLREESPNT
jgi:predicted PolB exonuclease-like 3'-5' exonuclease